MNSNSRRYMDFAPRRGGGSGGHPVVTREGERRVVVARASEVRPIKVQSRTQISVRSLDDKTKATMMPRKETKAPVSVVSRRRANDVVVLRGQTKSVIVGVKEGQKPIPKKKMPVAVRKVEPVLTVKPEDKPVKSTKVEREEVDVFDEFSASPDMDALDFGDGDEDDYWDRELGVVEDIEPISDKEIAEGANVVVAINERKSKRDDVQNKNKRQKLEDDRIGFKEGKSPFINTDKLEKRPLSAFRRGSSGPMPTKNSYAEQAKAVMERDDVPTMVVAETGKRSDLSIVVVIMMVVLLGAMAGFVMYLVFFQ